MKFIWHIIKKDLMRERWALLLWALLFVGQVAIGAVARQNDGAERDWVTYLELGNAGLVGLQLITGYILVARWVHADALVGTVMFWSTRPISAARLFVAKLVGALLVFGLLPVFLLLPWWLHCEFGWREILWTAVETVGWQLLMIAPAFLVASLTDELGRVLLWTLLLVIGVLSWVVLLGASFNSASGQAEKVGATLMFSRIWLAALVAVTGGILIAAHQYLTRRFVRSVVLVVLCLGLIALIGQAWRRNLAQFIGEWHEPALPPTVAGLVDGLTFTVRPAQGSFSERDPKLRNAANAREATLNVRLHLLGLPEEMSIGAESHPMTWTWPDGMKLARESAFHSYDQDPAAPLLRRIYSLPVPTADPETVQWRKSRNEEFDAKWRAKGWKPPYRRDPSAPIPPGVGMIGYTTLPNSFLAKMRAESPAFLANLHLILFRPEVIVDLPLKLDARASSRARTFHLRQLSRNKPMLLVTTRSSVDATGLWYSGLMRGEFRNWLFRDRILSVNHVTGDVGWVGENQEGSRVLQVAGVTLNWNRLFVQPPQVIRNGKWVAGDLQWLEHTTLVFLTDEEVARFIREVKTDKFELEPEPAN